MPAPYPPLLRAMIRRDVLREYQQGKSLTQVTRYIKNKYGRGSYGVIQQIVKQAGIARDPCYHHK
jgi:hypothetical protein